MLSLPKRVNIITGHYGSGKTNLSVNLAFELRRRGKKVCLVDLDTVNPYFRAADLTGELEEAGIRVIAPLYANTNLDIPALPASIYGVFEDTDFTVLLDVGGDDAGALALGQFSRLILSENNFEHFYVMNARRALTQTAEETVQVLHEIEAACHVPVTSLVNNTNLAKETTAETVRASFAFASEVSRQAGLPLRFTSVREELAGGLSADGQAAADSQTGEIYPVRVYIKTPWD
jgi:hypothetical protein